MFDAAHALVRTITFGRALTARGFLGRLSQRGLTIACQPERRTVALTAYTDRGTSPAAQLELPVDDLRRLARVLLDLADVADRQRTDLVGLTSAAAGMPGRVAA